MSDNPEEKQPHVQYAEPQRLLNFARKLRG